MSPYPSPAAWRAGLPDNWPPKPAGKPQELTSGIRETSDGALVVRRSDGSVKVYPPDRRTLDAWEKF